MDMKPLFRDTSPTRYPFVWQSRAAKFYNNTHTNHNNNTGNHNGNSSRPESPSYITSGHGQLQQQQSQSQQQHRSHRSVQNSHSNQQSSGHHSHQQSHHSHHHHHSHHQNHSNSAPNKSAKPSSGSSLFSPTYTQVHPPSRRPFFPTPPAVAPKPLTNTVTAASASNNCNVIPSASSFPLLDAELSCSSSSPTGGESSSNFDHDDSQPFVRITAPATHHSSNRLASSKMPRNYPDSHHHHHPSRYHQSHHRQTSPSQHHHYPSNRCPIGLCQKLASPPLLAPPGPTQFDPSRYTTSFDSFEYPLLQQYHHPFSFYSTPELHSSGRTSYYHHHFNSSPMSHRHHLLHHQPPQTPHHHHHHHPPPYHSQYQTVPTVPPPPYFVPYTSRSHVHLPSQSNPLSKKFDNPYAALRYYNETAKYRSSLFNRNNRLHNRRKCRGHLIVLSIILAVITVGVIMGVILAMTIN